VLFSVDDNRIFSVDDDRTIRPGTASVVSSKTYFHFADGCTTEIRIIDEVRHSGTTRVAPMVTYGACRTDHTI